MTSADLEDSVAGIRVLDLFSGAGGISSGFHLASPRFRTVRAVEFDVSAAATYAQNHGTDTIFAGSIQDWLRTEDVPSADIIVGGPPCQGFSTLGKQDAEDDRNFLWKRYTETIERSRPSYFVMENVPAFLTSAQFVEFQRQLAAGGSLADYAFQARILNAADFGAPQVRKRVVVIGHHRDLDFPGFPKKLYRPETWRTVRQAFDALPESVDVVDLPERRIPFGGRVLPGVFTSSELHLTRRYEQVSLDRISHIPSGGNRFDIPQHLLPPCWVNHKTGAGDVMGRLSWDKPSVTIRTEFYKPEKGRYLHPRAHRALTHHEAARIQGFADDYKWVGTKTAIGRQIGNAVPIPLARAIGRQLLAAIHREMPTTAEHVEPPRVPARLVSA